MQFVLLCKITGMKFLAFSLLLSVLHGAIYIGQKAAVHYRRLLRRSW